MKNGQCTRCHAVGHAPAAQQTPTTTRRIHHITCSPPSRPAPSRRAAVQAYDLAVSTVRDDHTNPVDLGMRVIVKDGDMLIADSEICGSFLRTCEFFERSVGGTVGRWCGRSKLFGVGGLIVVGLPGFVGCGLHVARFEFAVSSPNLTQPLPHSCFPTNRYVKGRYFDEF